MFTLAPTLTHFPVHDSFNILVVFMFASPESRWTTVTANDCNMCLLTLVVLDDFCAYRPPRERGRRPAPAAHARDGPQPASAQSHSLPLPLLGVSYVRRDRRRR